MNYTELTLEPNSDYSAYVCLDESTEFGKMSKMSGGMKMSWQIIFHTDFQFNVADIEDKAMGDLVRLEEYDFDMNSIALI